MILYRFRYMVNGEVKSDKLFDSAIAYDLWINHKNIHGIGDVYRSINHDDKAMEKCRVTLSNNTKCWYYYVENGKLKHTGFTM